MHDYLWVQFNFSKPGQVTVMMINYIKTIIAKMPEEMEDTAATPAASHLFNTNWDNPKYLDKDKSDMLYNMVMQLQHLSQQAWPGILTAVS